MNGYLLRLVICLDNTQSCDKSAYMEEIHGFCLNSLLFGKGEETKKTNMERNKRLCRRD